MQSPCRGLLWPCSCAKLPIQTQDEGKGLVVGCVTWGEDGSDSVCKGERRKGGADSGLGLFKLFAPLELVAFFS